MSVKINEKIVSIPPYISTSWPHIAALHMKGSLLAVTLIDGDTLNIPNLDSNTVDLIFKYHALYLESEEADHTEVVSQHESSTNENSINEMIEHIGGAHSIRLAFGGSVENYGTMMQHNPDQSEAPDLPAEILQKISMISKIIAPSDELSIPKAEIGCNCFYCQINRALNDSSEPEPLHISEEVSEEDLQFRQWDIAQIDERLFNVINRLDPNEKYQVFLGDPVGCTCGKIGCEHMLVVLKS